jgi:hypothetical protein
MSIRDQIAAFEAEKATLVEKIAATKSELEEETAAARRHCGKVASQRAYYIDKLSGDLPSLFDSKSAAGRSLMESEAALSEIAATLSRKVDVTSLLVTLLVIICVKLLHYCFRTIRSYRKISRELKLYQAEVRNDFRLQDINAELQRAARWRKGQGVVGTSLLLAVPIGVFALDRSLGNSSSYLYLAIAWVIGDELMQSMISLLLLSFLGWIGLYGVKLLGTNKVDFASEKTQKLEELWDHACDLHRECAEKSWDYLESWRLFTNELRLEPKLTVAIFVDRLIADRLQTGVKTPLQLVSPLTPPSSSVPLLQPRDNTCSSADAVATATVPEEKVEADRVD